MDILEHDETVTATIAKSFAESEFENYSVKQNEIYQSDFDKMVIELYNE